MVLAVAVVVRDRVGVAEAVVDLEGVFDTFETLLTTDEAAEVLVDRLGGIGFWPGGDSGTDTLLLTLVPAEDTLFTVRVSKSSSPISPSRGKGRKSQSLGLPKR
jgi:hypothetical protein